MLLLTEYSGCTIAMGRLQFRDSHSATDPSPSCEPGCAGQGRERQTALSREDRPQLQLQQDHASAAAKKGSVLSATRALSPPCCVPP